MDRRRFLVGCGAALSLPLQGAAGALAQIKPFSFLGRQYESKEAFITSGLRCGTKVPTLAESQRVLESLQSKESNLVIRGQTEIPVHFHVIHNGEDGRVPQARLAQQIEIMNAGFRGADIRFAIASANYHDRPEWFNMAPNTEAERAAKATLGRDTESALNFYTAAPTQGLLGWATFPWDLAIRPGQDGVVCLHSSLPGGGAEPFHLGQTGTHEVGHWLGLYHVFQNGCSTPGDTVGDTAFQRSPTSGCPAQAAPSCPGSTEADNINNFMDYSDDACLMQFTSGQTARMRQMIPLFRPQLLKTADGDGAVADIVNDLLSTD